MALKYLRTDKGFNFCLSEDSKVAEILEVNNFFGERTFFLFLFHQHLLFAHPPIQSLLPNQFIMTSHLHNSALIQYNNFICRRNRGQTVGDNESGFADGLFQAKFL